MDIFEIDRTTLNGLHGDDFEDIVEQYYNKLGYSTFKTPVTNDFGADIIVETPIGNIAIQCKRQSSNVNIKAVQEIYSSLRKYNAQDGIIITNAGYTNSAIELAKYCNIKLIDGNKFWNMILELQNNKTLINNKINIRVETEELLKNKEDYKVFMENINVEYQKLVNNISILNSKQATFEQSYIAFSKLNEYFSDTYSKINKLNTDICSINDISNKLNAQFSSIINNINMLKEENKRIKLYSIIFYIILLIIYILIIFI